MRRILVAPAMAFSLMALAACAGQAPAASPVATANDAVSKLHDFTLADLKAASADAHANNDQAAYQCYDFLAANLPTLPNFSAGQTVGAVLAFQKARDLVNGATQQNGLAKAINLACAPLVNDVNITLAKLGLLAGGTAATGGALAPIAAGLPAIGAALPIPIAP